MTAQNWYLISTTTEKQFCWPKLQALQVIVTTLKL